jgi:Uma2 family endonuclease
MAGPVRAWSLIGGSGMPIGLHSTNPADLESESVGHDYRLSADQFRRTIEARIIPEADGVELRDGFLFQEGSHYRLGVDQYREMARLGILTKYDRIELLEGWLIAKKTKTRPHTVCKGLTQDLLMPMTPAGWFLVIEGPTDTVDSEPEPDLMIVRGARRDYRERSPGPKDVALVIEVADSSLSRDRSTKKRLYARSGYSVYWLINLLANQIEVYTDPTGSVGEPDYLQRQDYGPNEMIPLVIEGREVGRLAVRDLLP